MLFFIGLVLLVIALAALARMRRTSDLEGYRCDPTITIDSEDLDWECEARRDPSVLPDLPVDRSADTVRSPGVKAKGVTAHAVELTDASREALTTHVKEIKL